jgi:BirA family biotin operon repressor/biotin-[acetyl-CoA-carboxylase] ligase
MTDLQENQLRQRLKGSAIGNPLWVFPELPSTNDWLKEHLNHQQTPQGALVIADYQSRGRGRLSRTWLCPPGKGLLFSFYWIPRLNISQWTLYSMAAGLAVYDLLTSEIPDADKMEPVQFVWPNDVLAGGKKICGILSETARTGLVVGIGVNVLHDSTELPEADATSIALWSQHKIHRSDLMVQLIPHLSNRFAQLDREETDSLLSEITNIGPPIGNPIQVQLGSNTLNGTYQGLSPRGALLLQTPEGTTQELVVVGRLTFAE